MIANTKGFTGHAMGTGIEDVVAVKALETGCVPPVANFKEVDPELGQLNLSKGGAYPVEYAIHLGAGFGSQISMMLLHWIKTKNGIRPSPNALGYAYRIADANAWSAWLSSIAGRPVADLEVVHRTLRVRDQGAAARVADAAKESDRTRNASENPHGCLTEPSEHDRKQRHPVAHARKRRWRSRKERILHWWSRRPAIRDMLDLDLISKPTSASKRSSRPTVAAIREIYSIPRDENRKLRDYPTWRMYPVRV